MVYPNEDMVGPPPDDSPQYQALREFLEAIEACNKALDAEEQKAVSLEIAASEALGRAEPVMRAIEDALTEDWDTFVEVAEATDRAIDETTATAKTTEETELPEAAHRLEEVPSLLDAAVDPGRAELVARFQAARDEGFALVAGSVQQAATSIEAADGGGSPLQPFLELPGEVHALAVAHASDQQQEVVHIDQHAAALAAANDATHAAADAGARTWGETCVTAVENHCGVQADAVRDLYAGWEQTAQPQEGEVEQALESARTRLTTALDTEDGTVDRETTEAQESLDRLHEQMRNGSEELDQGESIFMTLAEMALPELAIARRMVDKLKDLAEAMGS